MRHALIAVLAACGGSTPPAAIEGHATTRAHPTTPAPSITWIDNGFDANGLPAVANDGSTVVLAIHAEDGGRGAPNLTVVVLDRHDTATATVPVLGVDEAEAMFDEHGVKPALRARIQAANAHLAGLHAQHDLVALAELAIDDTLEAEQRLRATGPDLTVEWKAGQLELRDHQREVGRVTIPASWLVEDRPMCTTCTEICHNAAYLGRVAADAKRRVAVVTISYTGTDTCWEPSSQHHVVAW
jgi:hypothetical protein